MHRTGRFKPQQSHADGGWSNGWQQQLVSCCEKLVSQPFFDVETFPIVDVRHSVCSSSNGLSTGTAVPDTSCLALDGNFSAESAGVTGVLRDFDLFDLLTERGTVTMRAVRKCTKNWTPPPICHHPSSHAACWRTTKPTQRSTSTSTSTSFGRVGSIEGCECGWVCVPGTVFTGDADLLCALRHVGGCVVGVIIDGSLGGCSSFRSPLLQIRLRWWLRC